MPLRCDNYRPVGVVSLIVDHIQLKIWLNWNFQFYQIVFWTTLMLLALDTRMAVMMRVQV